MMGSFTLLPVDSASGMTPSMLDRRASYSDVSCFNPSWKEVFHLLLWSTGMIFRLLSSVEKTECTLGLSEAILNQGSVDLLLLAQRKHIAKTISWSSYPKTAWFILCRSTMVGSCCQYLLLSLEQEHYQQVYDLLMPCWGLFILSGSWYLKEWV